MLFGAFKKSFAVSLAVASLAANAWNDNGEWPFAKMGCGYVSRHISFVEKQMKRLRVFVTAYGVGQREVVELKERFDFEPVLLPVLDRENFSVWYPKREPPYAESMSETEYAQELEKRLSQLSDCEAILIGRSYPASIPGEVLQRLLNRVSDGAGLVWIAPWDGFEEIPGVELSEQLDANFFPTELIPALRGTRIWSGKYGKGSVMEVVYPMPVNEFKGANGVVADRQMYLETLTPYESDDPLYYDFCHAFLGKCLWQVVGWNPELPKREEVIAYNSLGEAVPTGSRSAQLELIRYLNSEGLTVDYSVQMCEKSTKVGIRLEKDAIKPGEHIRGEIVGTTGCKEIVISLVDDAQRVIWRQVFSDVEEIPLDISLEHQQSKYALFRVDADDDLAWTNVYFNTVDEDREDFTFTIWSNHGSSSRVSRLGLDQLRQAGVDNVMECTWGCVSQNLMRRIPRRIKEAGINYSPYATFIRGPTAEVAQGSDCVMMDAWPEYCRTGAFRVEDGGRNHNSTRVMDIAEASRDIGAFFYSLGDENSLSKDETDENCFCDKCQERFRNYLKRTYGTMSVLNAEYGSQYLNWSEIHPLQLEEARSRGLIPLWMDFRDFMEGQWVDLHRYVAAQVQSMDSNAVLGIEGMAPPEKWYTGWNFYRLLPYFRFAAPYFKGRDVRALQYLGNKSVRGAWYGSYEGQMSESSMRRTPWLYLFAGLNGTFWWTANFTQKGCSFSNCNVFRPDLTMLDHFSQSAKEVRFIKESGIGKLMAGARPFPTGVRVHYSNPCLRMSAACPESVSWAESMENFESVLEEGAIAYSYLSPQELESAVLDDIKVLVLPQSRAMSDAECDAVVRFVRKGGLLIADSIPAAYDEHGRLREVNPLAELFVTNSIAPHKVGDGYTVLTLDVFQNAAISAKEGLSGAMITNMWELLALAGVEPFVKVLDGVHNIVRADVFENNGVVLVGMIGPSLPLSAESVESLRTVNLRNDMWAYDLGKDGKCLGRGKSFAIELDPLIGRVLAFSAEEIQPKGVKVDRKWIRPGERLCATIRESCGVHLISVEDSRGEVVFRDRVSGAKVSYVPTWNDKEGKYVMRIKSVVGGHEQLVEFFVSNSPNGIRATWDANAKPMHSEVKTVLTWTQNGNLTVDKGGICEVLLVGGGGGGGAYANDNQGGAGGGAGGVIYRNSFLLEPGTYEINVGNGGEIGKNGGDTQAFGLTAYGGGGGSSGVSPWGGMNGGSGGGAAFGAGSAAGGKAVYGVAGNLGHDGGGSVHIYGAGGGGGAGGPGVTPTGSEAGNGGHGFSCSISGNSVFYAGGGGAYRVSTPTQGGIGGGGAGGVSGSPGTGGGGGGNAAGGSGIVIISFMRDGDYMSDDFNLKGGDDVFPAVDDTVVVFRKDGKLRIDGSGSVELLMVGGGGGGGSGDDVLGGAGGGAGGFVHFENFPVTSGVYDVKIGLGGLVNSNGGDTALSGLGFVAYGGGAGSAGQSVWGGRNGASGGGGATAGGVGGRAIFLDECNIGNDGGAASNVYGPGGGGGAGACGESTGTSSPGRGGAGLPCTITGKLQYYAGGGSGYRKSIPVAGSRGGGGGGGVAGLDGTGGGGGGCAVGGSGILILRYHRQNYRANIEGAAGGEVVEMNGFRMHTFAKDEQFSIPYDGAIEVLLVGGGGGGGVSHPEDANRGGGGGGAGGVVHRHMILQKGKYDVQIGAGGAIGTNGQDTVAFGLVALGGGHGGWYDGVKPPGDGGSGGGAAVFSGMASGGLAIGAVKNNLGNEGGGSIHIYGAGGGGGAGSGGKTSTGSQPGEGGIGYQCEISGTSVYYAGGGAGFRQGVVTSGGLGGGGAGGSAGEPGTGGGGGGGASGGNGIVIVRYRVVDPSGLIITVK